MRRFLLFLLMVIPSLSFADDWLSNRLVANVAIINGSACVRLASGEYVKLNIGTDEGQAEYSMALTALTAELKVDVLQTDAALVGGCNSGTSIRPHSVFRIKN